MLPRLDQSQQAARHLELHLICGASRERNRQAKFFRVAAKPEQSDGESDDGEGEPREQRERKGPDEDDVAIKLLLLMQQRFLAKQRQWIATIVRSARV